MDTTGLVSEKTSLKGKQHAPAATEPRTLLISRWAADPLSASTTTKFAHHYVMTLKQSFSRLTDSELRLCALLSTSTNHSYFHAILQKEHKLYEKVEMH